MKLQISELARLTGVSVRTLHYYDTIGLLKPARVDANTGYRYYDETSMEKLQQILYYKDLNFALKDIPELMAEKEYEKKKRLLERAGSASLDALLQTYIFDPLEMTNTSYEGQADIVGYSNDTPVPCVCAHNNISWGLLSTAEDLGKWFDVLLNRKLLSPKSYKKLFPSEEDAFSCGWYQNRNRYGFLCEGFGMYHELWLNYEKQSCYFSVRNKATLPDNHNRLMYFTIPGCDNGSIKLEAWELDTDTCVKITSMKIFDKDAKELYFFPRRSNEYLLFVENHGEKRHASDFIHDDSYYLTLNFAEILGAQFDPTATYILEVRAECDFENSSQIGIKYIRNQKEQCMGYYIFYNDIQPYELFMEALENVMEVI